ncbi:uncharacterized protein LOC132731366 [Ruditapes philippinarum]|uniref:uncharacterized protein LOC132731366 n=1 Tax=Ruditapes philippinarum TaxID=129788 RepID=UPI00295AF434|nr:uncharacterized protein LOC132731366 [Ruditapes philippinarum]XP_060573523.1 uncharacterized protein LOC132731366 [Ruditapes philippinarum]
MAITYNYSALVNILSRSENCSSGNKWIWKHTSQCVEETGHLAGFIFGSFAIALSAVSYLSLSVIHVRRINKSHTSSSIVTTVLHWFSELSALIGAFLSLQLPTQIIYSAVLLSIHTICFIYVCINQNIKTLRNVTTDKKGSLLLRAFLYPCILIMPIMFTTMLTLKSFPNVKERFDNINENTVSFYKTGMTISFYTGYNLGILAAILLCGARSVEVVHLLRYMDNHRCIPCVYMTSILGGISYIYSVLSQSLSLVFIYHTLPWTLPRLITVGIDVGIFTQHLLYTKQSRKRKISNEDAETLLSSEEDTDFSDDGSEEVIWMPLKTFDYPTNYQISRLQIVSESEPIDLNIDDNEVEPVNNSANDIDSKVNTENSDKMIEDNHITAGDVVSTQDDIAEIELIKDDLQSDIETSSSESDSSKHIVTNNNIVKKNIATLAEVSKEEKIVSWMNSK